jgi:hypothetical protein
MPVMAPHVLTYPLVPIGRNSNVTNTTGRCRRWHGTQRDPTAATTMRLPSPATDPKTVPTHPNMPGRTEQPATRWCCSDLGVAL